MKKRIYIAPDRLGVVNGVEVESKVLTSMPTGSTSSCKYCAVRDLKMCFDKFGKQKDSRPACFGNDPENLSKKPLFYKAI